MVADNGTNLSAIDTRTGRRLYSYQSVYKPLKHFSHLIHIFLYVDISGTITSIAACHNNLMVSTSQDRFLRLHLVMPPGEQGKPLEKKGEVLGSLFLHATPTAVVCDPHIEDQTNCYSENSDEDSDDDVWNGLQNVNDSEAEESQTRKRTRPT